MKLPKITVREGYNTSVPELLAMFRAVKALFMAQPVLTPPWPDFLPSPEEIDAQMNDLEAAHAKVFGHPGRPGMDLMVEFMNARRILKAMVCEVAAYVEDVGTGYADLKAHPGYHLRGNPAHRQAWCQSPMPPPRVFAREGETIGSVLVRSKRILHPSSVELQWGEVVRDGEVNWGPGYLLHTPRLEIRGLIAGKFYAVRMRFIDGKGKGPWSDMSVVKAAVKGIPAELCPPMHLENDPDADTEEE